MTGSTDEGHRKEATPAQVAANRSNAQRSTGPKTAEGRSRSSQNALRHGIYARQGVAVTCGPFEEDTAEVADFLRDVLDALAPRDVLEVQRANRIAMLQLQERRLDGYEASLLQPYEVAAGAMEQEQQDDAMDEAHDHVFEWNERRRDERGLDEDPEWYWQGMALWCRCALNSKLQVTGLWDDLHEPASPQQWRRAFEAIAKHRFPAPDDLTELLCRVRDERYEKTQARESIARQRVARSSLSTIDGCNTMRARVTNELGRQFAMYALLQARELPEGI